MDLARVTSEDPNAGLPEASQLGQLKTDLALAIAHGVVPPTANLHEPDPECDLDYTPLVARERHIDTVLSVGSGFGGFQSAMVLARAEGEAQERDTW